MSAHVKKADEVVVIAGADKGKRGRIIEVQTNKQTVLIEGVHMIKRHLKKGSAGAQQQGTILEREAPVHISNVMRADRYDARAAKRGAAQPAEKA